MANRFFLDGVEITSELQEQASINDTETFIPAGAKWFNLLPIIFANNELNKKFFTADIHTLTIQSDSGVSTAKMFIKAKYTARNR